MKKENVKVRGVVHTKGYYNGWSLSKFKEVFAKQIPYKKLPPEQREKALEEDYAILNPGKQKKESQKIDNDKGNSLS